MRTINRRPQWMTVLAGAIVGLLVGLLLMKILPPQPLARGTLLLWLGFFVLPLSVASALISLLWGGRWKYLELTPLETINHLHSAIMHDGPGCFVRDAAGKVYHAASLQNTQETVVIEGLTRGQLVVSESTDWLLREIEGGVLFHGKYVGYPFLRAEANFKKYYWELEPTM